MTALLPLAIALQGIGYATHLLATQGLLPEEEDTPTDPPTPAAQGGGGVIPLRKPGHSAPWHWVPFHPVAPKRPRKKRQAEILFLGH